MSCITEILKLKGDKEFLPIERADMTLGIVVEDGGIYKDYEYLVTFNDSGFRCGYVAISETHPIYNSEEEYPDYDVHGGVTFFDHGHIVEDILGHMCTDKWIGFDCGHCYDLNDWEQAKKYFKNNEYISKKIIKIQEIRNHFEDKEPRIKNRTKEYVIEQCKHLIDQLIQTVAS